MRYMLMSAVFALGLVVLTACQNTAPPVKIESARAANTNSVSSAAQTDAHEREDNAPRITLADAKKDFDAGKAVFIDTRAETAYKQEHIKGAINMPMETVEARYKQIPAGKKVIAYCS